MPNRLTMEGMLEKSNRVLEQAAKMDRNGSLQVLFKQAKGIVLLSVVESGVLVSGSIGSGIMMTRDEHTGEWSLPCACGLTGTGYGFAIGAVVKDIVMFAFDDKSVISFASKLGVKMNVGTSVTIGTYGVDAGANLSLSKSGTSGTANVANHGLGGTVSICFSKGAYASASVSGGVVGTRDSVNRAFYGDSSISASKILFGGKELKAGIQENSTLNAVYEKLSLLTRGVQNEVLSEPLAEVEAEIPNEATDFIDSLASNVTQQLENGSSKTVIHTAN